MKEAERRAILKDEGKTIEGLEPGPVEFLTGQRGDRRHQNGIVGYADPRTATDPVEPSREKQWHCGLGCADAG
jgi:hypothetical protein